VFPLKDAVVNPNEAEVNKLAVAVFKDEVLEPTAVNLVSTDAVYIANVVFFVSCDEVKLFNALMSVVTALPVLTIILNVVLLPFVKVIVLRFTEAVVNPKLAEVNKLAVAVFNEDVTLANVVSFVSCEEVKLFKLLIDTNADALNVFKLVIDVTNDAVDCDAVKVFNAATELLRLAVVLSMFVNLVNVLALNVFNDEVLA